MTETTPKRGRPRKKPLEVTISMDDLFGAIEGCRKAIPKNPIPVDRAWEYIKLEVHNRAIVRVKLAVLKLLGEL